jgi:hypothetical protein
MSFSDFLFARGGFSAGVARALQLGGGASTYNYALSPEQADMLAIYADWRSVGGDMHKAFARAAKKAAVYQPSLFD